ncbi:amine oxidase [Actinophytocola xinjiangensis]|uniref:Amine oxidase n=1 Tax=Actinophytocola xinjiangensis TaxID=485602 RepID=A0A7Z0WQL7_9PSEU|nr:FAD-dependent oxidoreductase [Actinophytocola xinjiangensis]OLF13138.1 amine oxidase [Actinophytocola xinjiangensis]
MDTDLDVAVVGAGVAGLSLAYRLRHTGLSVRVFEAAGHVGGRMASFRHHGYTVDTGAEQVPTHGYEQTWRLLRELGMSPAEAPRVGGPIAVWRDGRGRPGVTQPRGLLTGAGLSPRARLDLARLLAATARQGALYDPDRPEDTPLGSRTVAQLAARYHPDVGDYQLGPVVSTFFGWNPARSAAAPFVSLMNAAGPVSTWRTYAGGMDTLARRLAGRVDVVTGAGVREVVAGTDSALVRTDHQTLCARAVVLCVPAPVAAQLYVNAPDGEREFLAACGFTPVLKVSCLLDRPLAPGPRRRTYALLVPEVERGAGDPVGAILADHVKHPGRAPAGRGLLTVMAAPTAIPALFDAPDEEVVRVLTTAAQRYVPGLADATVVNFVHRFRHGLPEATPEALGLRRAFAARPLRPVDYAGDWLVLRPSSEGAIRTAATTAARIARLTAARPIDVKEAV